MRDNHQRRLGWCAPGRVIMELDDVGTHIEVEFVGVHVVNVTKVVDSSSGSVEVERVVVVNTL